MNAVCRVACLVCAAVAYGPWCASAKAQDHALPAAPVRNGSFEAGEAEATLPAGWQARPPTAVTWTAHENTDGRLVTLASEDPKSTPLLIQTDLPLEPGQAYRGVYDALPAEGTSFRVYVEWWKEDGTYGRAASTGWRAGSGRWQRHYFSFTFPTGMKPPYIVLQLEGPGTCSFDNVALTPRQLTKAAPGVAFNDDFENGAGLWELPFGSDIQTGNAASGEAYLAVTSDHAEHNPAAVYRDIPTVSGRAFRLSYRVRSGGGSAEVTGFQHFRVMCSWERLVRDGRDYGTVSQKEGLEWQDCFASWQRRTLTFRAPTKPTGGMVLSCQVRGPGAVHLDAIVLEEIEDEEPEPPIDVAITNPHYRAMWFTGQDPGPIAGIVWTTDPAVARVRIAMKDLEESIVKEMPPLAQGIAQVTFQMPASTGTVTVDGLDADGKGLGALQRDILVAPPPAENQAGTLMRADGIPLVDGVTPFFPVGLWRGPSNEKQAAELAAAGFNVVRSTADGDALNMLRRFGIKAMVSVPSSPPDDPDERAAWEADVKERFAPLKADDNILGYYLCDEPLWNGRPLGPLTRAYAFYRKWDPYRPLWINMAPRGTVLDLARYNRACDITGVDIYPVPEGGSHSEMENKTLSCVGDYTVKTHQSVAFQKPVWMTLQGFAWGHNRSMDAKGVVYPDAAQSRFMAYDAVIHGAQGIMYWGTHSIADPDFWEVLFQTARDLHETSQVIVGETVKNSKVQCSSPKIAWIHKRALPPGTDDAAAAVDVVIAANEHNETVTVEFSLPFAGDRVALYQGPLSAGPARSMAAQNGRLVDTFAPYEVKLYGADGQALPRPRRALLDAETVARTAGMSYADLARMRRDSEPYRGEASWIWFPETSNEPFSECVLRRTIDLEILPEKAVIMATADDAFELYVNGERVAEDNAWNRLRRHDITALLRQGVNVIAAHARDGGVAPAAFLADMTMRYADGREQNLVSDAAWKAHKTPAEGWKHAQFGDAQGVAAEVVAPYGSGPWEGRLIIVP